MGRLKMEPAKMPKQRQRKDEEDHDQKHEHMIGHDDPRCLKWGAFQLIKLQTRQISLTSSPTPTLVRTTPPTPRPTHIVPTAPPLPKLVQHPPLFSDDNNKDAVSFSQPVQAGDLIIVAITQWV